MMICSMNYMFGEILWGKIDVTPKGEDRALLSEIKRVIINKYYNGKAPEYLNVEIVGSTSDETVCFRNIPFMSLGVMIEQTMATILIIITMAMMLCFIRMAMFTQLKRLMKAELLMIVFLKNCQK